MLNDKALNLSLEQQFRLKALSEQAKELTGDQAKELLIEVVRQNMLKDNLVRHWMLRDIIK